MNEWTNERTNEWMNEGLASAPSLILRTSARKVLYDLPTMQAIGKCNFRPPLSMILRSREWSFDLFYFQTTGCTTTVQLPGTCTRLWTGAVLFSTPWPCCEDIQQLPTRDGSTRGWQWPHWWVPSLRNYTNKVCPLGALMDSRFWSVSRTKLNQNQRNFHLTKFLFSSLWHRANKSKSSPSTKKCSPPPLEWCAVNKKARPLKRQGGLSATRDPERGDNDPSSWHVAPVRHRTLF